jgi:hypothetical protein
MKIQSLAVHITARRVSDTIHAFVSALRRRVWTLIGDSCVIRNALRNRDVVKDGCEQCDRLRVAGLIVLESIFDGVERKSCAMFDRRQTSREALRPSLDAIAYSLTMNCIARGKERDFTNDKVVSKSETEIKSNYVRVA